MFQIVRHRLKVYTVMIVEEGNEEDSREQEGQNKHHKIPSKRYPLIIINFWFSKFQIRVKNGEGGQKGEKCGDGGYKNNILSWDLQYIKDKPYDKC